MKKLVIFDLDGTLLDTVPDICDGLNFVLDEFGLNRVTEEQTTKFIGDGVKKLVERVLSDKTDDACVISGFLDRFCSVYANHSNSRTCVFDGMEETVKKLKNLGIKSAILTNKPQPTTDAVVKKFLSGFCFDKVIGQTANVKVKPSPEQALKLIEYFGVKKEETVIVGDGEPDVLTAKNAEIDCVSVLWGYRDKSALAAVGANNFCSNSSELFEILSGEENRLND